MIAQRAALCGVRAAAVIEYRTGIVLFFGLDQQAAAAQGVVYLPNIPVAGRIETNARRAADGAYHIALDEQFEDLIAVLVVIPPPGVESVEKYPLDGFGVRPAVVFQLLFGSEVVEPVVLVGAFVSERHALSERLLHQRDVPLLRGAGEGFGVAVELRLAQYEIRTSDISVLDAEARLREQPADLRVEALVLLTAHVASVIAGLDAEVDIVDRMIVLHGFRLFSAAAMPDGVSRYAVGR